MFAILIIKSNISLIDFIIKKSIKKIKFKSGYIYIIDNLLDINEGIELLLKMRLWHKPVFHMMICKKILVKKIIALSKDKSTTLDSIENILKNEIDCYIDPVDNQLEFYGSMIAKNLIYEVFCSS